jgi:hypothetical protein
MPRVEAPFPCLLAEVAYPDMSGQRLDTPPPLLNGSASLS